MLYQPERYEPLAGEWDEERARAGIRAIVADADAAFGGAALWPAAEWDSWRTPTPLKTLYVGAAGVIWRLDALARRGHAESQIDLAAAAEGTVEEWRRLAGAELVWLAGPPTLEKGPGICHGTAGNGYALLAAFARTGDEEWLARARRFAVHALDQVARGDGRYSLWTGDIGAALFAADCLDASSRYPVLG
jgi:hypothetical protein